jgi:hypothetical protein
MPTATSPVTRRPPDESAMLTVRSAVPVMSSVDGNEREEDRRCPELGLRGDVEQQARVPT